MRGVFVSRHERGDTSGCRELVRRTDDWQAIRATEGRTRERCSREARYMSSVPDFCPSRPFNRPITFEWIWHTRLSVSASISPISRIVWPTW